MVQRWDSRTSLPAHIGRRLAASSSVGLGPTATIMGSNAHGDPNKKEAGRVMVELFSKGEAWRDFRYLETELIEALEFVPLRKRHNDVWSPKFGMILDQTGSATASFFEVVIEGGRLFQDRERKEIEKLTIVDYRNIVEPVYKLSTAEVSVSDGPVHYDSFCPFGAFGENKAPEWWSGYNEYKHYRYSLRESATLKNTVHALAGLFALNVLHKENQEFLIENGVIRATDRYAMAVPENSLSSSNFGIKSHLRCGAQSRLFHHVFRFDGGTIAEVMTSPGIDPVT